MCVSARVARARLVNPNRLRRVVVPKPLKKICFQIKIHAPAKQWKQMFFGGVDMDGREWRFISAIHSIKRAHSATGTKIKGKLKCNPWLIAVRGVEYLNVGVCGRDALNTQPRIILTYLILFLWYLQSLPRIELCNMRDINWLLSQARRSGTCDALFMSFGSGVGCVFFRRSIFFSGHVSSFLCRRKIHCHHRRRRSIIFCWHAAHAVNAFSIK